MIVTLTGAFKNAGDYLIGQRARTLVATHVDSDVVDINRKAITDKHYDTFNRARAVLLTGGPAYQKNIYPGVYDLDLDRITVPVLAFGLGWKGNLRTSTAEFRFTDESTAFVQRIHANKSLLSSCRDQLTVEVLHLHDVDNVLMTGCPAWYDETKLAQDYEFNPNIKRIVLSMPAVPHAQMKDLIKGIRKLFPKAEKFLAFQSGYTSSHSTKGAEYTRENLKLLALGRINGFKPISFESDFVKFNEFMDTIDFHVGYRVHSHIYTLSQRKPSVLIAEDSRGVGQVEALGGIAITMNVPAFEVLQRIENHLNSHGNETSIAIAKMQATHPVMLRYLEQFA